MKCAYVVQGFGEFSQAEAFARYAQTRGDSNIFICDDPALIDLIKKSGFEVIRATTTHKTQQIIRKARPDVLFLCNSKTVYMRDEAILKEAPLPPRPLTASFDSNWLFLNHKKSLFRVPEWLDLPLVVMPEVIYTKGLKKNGGRYTIGANFAQKIFCPGFIPSGFRVSSREKAAIRGKLGIKPGEKLIFSYFGIREPLILQNYVSALEKIIPQLEKNGKKVKVFLKIHKELKHLPRADWLLTKKWLSAEDYVRYLAAADLVIQHHGLGTLPKVIRNQVPALCVVPDLAKKYAFYEHSPSFEIEAFQRLGLCASIPYSFSATQLSRQTQRLLFNKKVVSAMKKAQARVFQSGEKTAYNHIVSRLKKII